MKLRTTEPFMPADEYGRPLKSLSLNLLVRDIEKAVAFQRDVFGVTLVYSDPDFAVLEWQGAQWMLHADHTCDKHPLRGLLAGVDGRGAGIELRLHGCDPDKAEAAARRLGYYIVAPAADKPHGLREAFIADPDGYLWVPDAPIKPPS
ncbi:MAG: hypothetical protein FJ030_10600 [Chloroflexi bacterium]|nr:hypothetical protein [Chloroflexota bacterium]